MAAEREFGRRRDGRGQREAPAHGRRPKTHTQQFCFHTHRFPLPLSAQTGVLFVPCICLPTSSHTQPPLFLERERVFFGFDPAWAQAAATPLLSWRERSGDLRRARTRKCFGFVGRHRHHPYQEREDGEDTHTTTKTKRTWATPPQRRERERKTADPSGPCFFFPNPKSPAFFHLADIFGGPLF